MAATDPIPAFGLYGETDAFPDVVHHEDLSERAPGHDWSIAPHRHEKMSQMFIISDGQVVAQVDGSDHALTSGYFLYIPEHCVHGFQFKPGTVGSVLSFPTSLVRTTGPNAQELVETLANPFSGPMTAQLTAGAASIRAAAESEGPFRVAQLVGLAHFMLAGIADLQGIDQRKPRLVRPARLVAFDRLIAEHMQDGWTVTDYASALSVSSGHLSRLSRSATGLGANAYIQQKVMEEACRLLAFTQLPVSEVGYRLGYLDPSYFSKRFRADRGETPSDYRAKFTSRS